MARRSRSDVTWQRVEPRRRVGPLLLVIVVVAVVAFIGYMNAGMLDGLGIGDTAPARETAADITPMRKQGRQRGAGSLRLSTAPRAGPMPRQGASPRRAPRPRGEVERASR